MSKWEIYVMDDDGSNVKRLTHNNVYDAHPRWSPNGKYIAFERDQERENNEQNLDLFLMNLNGTQVRQLTTYTGIDINPAWSPDSQNLAFTSTRDGATSIHTIDIETQEVSELTRNMNVRNTGNPDWSPDGKHIVYISARRNPFQEGIYVMDADGKNPRPFVRDAGTIYFSPRWSPDGKHILYGEAKQGKNEKIVIQSKNGALVKELVLPPIKRWFMHLACWMGTRHILIHAAEENGHGQSDILRYTIATDDIVNLTNSPKANDGFPDWIDDASLSVLPYDKLTIQWGKLKQMN